MTTKIKTGSKLLALGALGVVFGDIGTSPLYAFSVIFGSSGHHLAINPINVLGVISLVVWSITLVVSIKYIAFIMRADNEGEGGIMALVSKIKDSKLKAPYKWVFLALGLLGVSLCYGDIMITPAISVLSAVEGLKVIAPQLEVAIVPITLAILASLFAIQKYGTALIGRLFGPVMLLWFVVIAVGGGAQVLQHPEVLHALSPATAISFFVSHPLVAFGLMGAVILVVTGAEALYADMGHFGRKPIARAWFFVVFPALVLCYMGEGALLLYHPEAASNPFIFLYPDSLHIPIVILATLAAVIASQSVISGMFSLTRQVMQLDFLPKALVKHTSTRVGGQIYVPFANAVLFVAVCLLVILFGSSANLANAYGIAVSGTLAADTILYLVLMYSVWQKSLRRIVLIGLIFIPLDILFVVSSMPKIVSGGWLPILVASLVFLLISTWVKGQLIVVRERKILEGPLQKFIDKVQTQKPPVNRVSGAAIYISPHSAQTPLALHATLDNLHELHEKVVVVYVKIATIAHIPEDERAVYDPLQYDDGISYVSLSFGFHDVVDIPEILKYLQHTNSELDFNLDEASYFISRSRVILTKRRNLSHWRKSLYSLMARNKLSASDYYKLPIERTIEMRSFIKL